MWQAVGGAIAVVAAIILVNGFSMLFGELVPKNFALSHPLGTARTVAPLQRGFTRALRPVISFFNGSANALLRRVGVEPREELSGGRSAQELASLVRRSAEVGTLDVIEDGTGSLVVYSQQVEPHSLGRIVGPAVAGGIEGIRTYFAG